MDFLFLRDPTVPNLEGELLVEEDGESVSDVGNACCAPFAGVAGALGAGVATGVDMGAPLVAGFSDSATGVASARAVSAGAGVASETTGPVATGSGAAGGSEGAGGVSMFLVSA